MPEPCPPHPSQPPSWHRTQPQPPPTTFQGCRRWPRGRCPRRHAPPQTRPTCATGIARIAAGVRPCRQPAAAQATVIANAWAKGYRQCLVVCELPRTTAPCVGGLPPAPLPTFRLPSGLGSTTPPAQGSGLNSWLRPSCSGPGQGPPSSSKEVDRRVAYVSTDPHISPESARNPRRRACPRALERRGRPIYRMQGGMESRIGEWEDGEREGGGH